MNPLAATSVLIIRVLFDSYIFILLIRFLMQKLGASWHNPLSQFVFQLTEPLLKFSRKIIPGHRGFDFAILLLAVVLQLIETALLMHILFGATFVLTGGLLISLGEILRKFIQIYFYSIIIFAITTWVPSIQGNPVSQITQLITEPLLSRARRIIPLIAGVDISPIFILLGLTLINELIPAQLILTGTKLFFG